MSRLPALAIAPVLLAACRNVPSAPDLEPLEEAASLGGSAAAGQRCNSGRPQPRARVYGAGCRRIAGGHTADNLRCRGASRRYHAQFCRHRHSRDRSHHSGHNIKAKLHDRPQRARYSAKSRPAIGKERGVPGRDRARPAQRRAAAENLRWGGVCVAFRTRRFSRATPRRGAGCMAMRTAHCHGRATSSLICMFCWWRLSWEMTPRSMPVLAKWRNWRAKGATRPALTFRR
jgi:hypothetical protein